MHCVNIAGPKKFRINHDVLKMNKNTFRRVEDVLDGVSIFSYRKVVWVGIPAQVKSLPRSGIIYEAMSSTIMKHPMNENIVNPACHAAEARIRSSSV